MKQKTKLKKKKKMRIIEEFFDQILITVVKEKRSSKIWYSLIWEQIRHKFTSVEGKLEALGNLGRAGVKKTHISALRWRFFPEKGACMWVGVSKVLQGKINFFIET